MNRVRITAAFVLALIVSGCMTTARTPPRTAAGPSYFSVGSHGDAWLASAVAIAGTSNALDTIGGRDCSAFGTVSAATTISVQLSADNVNFYTSTVGQTLAGAGNFGFSFAAGARFVRLVSSAATTVTATISCKG
jgi:hypothetical protein